jgi:prevent-host-death family protein
MPVVSVTELNQQTAKVLERVKAGESLEVREHGRPIARIVPILSNASIAERLVSEGRLIRATKPSALFALVPARAAGELTLSDMLARAREAERF